MVLGPLVLWRGPHAYKQSRPEAAGRAGACTRAVRAGRRPRRDARGAAECALAAGCGAVGARPQDVPAGGLWRGGRGPHGARPGGVAGHGRGVPLPGPPRPAMGGQAGGRRRGGRSLPCRGAPRGGGKVPGGGQCTRAVAPRAARGLRLLCVEHVWRGRRGGLCRRAAPAGGHGLHGRGRRLGRDGARHVLRARRRGRRVSRAGDLPGAAGVLWRRGGPRSPYGALDRPDHRRAGLCHSEPVPRDRADGPDGGACVARTVQPRAERLACGRGPGDAGGPRRGAHARQVPARALRGQLFSHGPHERGRAGGACGAARPV